MPYAEPSIELSITGNNTGVFTFDSSLFDGPDVFGGIFGGDAFDDITADVKLASGSRGRSSDLSAIEMGTMGLTLKDLIGKYNPKRRSYADEVMVDGPVGYWRLGEAEGATQALDSSGNLRHGTHTGGVILGASGAPSSEVDTAARFDGTDDYVSIPDDSAFDFAGTASFTLEAWVQPDAIAAAFRTIIDKESSTGGRNGWSFGLHSTSGLYVTRMLNGTLQSASALSSWLTAGQWNHVAASYGSATLRVYVNGVERATGASAQSLSNNTQVVAIGRSTVFGLYWLGALDDVAVYGDALSAARILAHYEAGTLYLGKRLQPMRRIRCRLTYGGSTRGRFSGFTQRIWHNPAKDVRESYITAVDAFTWLQRVTPVVASTGPTTVGAAIGLTLDAAGWPAGERTVDDGSAIPDFSADGTKSALQVIQDLLAADLGLFFIDKDGLATYLDRDSRWVGDPVATLSGDLISGALPGIDGERIVNGQTCTRAGGEPQTVTDAASRAFHGPRDGAPVNSPYWSDDGRAAANAALRVALQKDPAELARALTLHNRDATTIGHQLDLEFGQIVTVAPPTDGSLGTAVGDISRVDWAIDLAGRHDTVNLTVTERVLTGFAFDDSVFDGPDVFL